MGLNITWPWDSEKKNIAKIEKDAEEQLGYPISIGDLMSNQPAGTEAAVTDATKKQAELFGAQADLLKQQYPYLGQIMEEGSGIYEGRGAAPTSPYEQQYMSSLAGQAQQSPYEQQAGQTIGGMMQPQDSQAMGLLGRTAQGGMVGQNPYLDAAFNRGADQIQSRMGSTFGGAGRFGGGLHQAGMAKGLGDYASQLYGGAYGQERALQQQAQQSLLGGEQVGRAQQMQAAGMAPMLQQMGGYRAGLLGQAGQADIARQQRQQSYPWEQLAQFRGAVTGATPQNTMMGGGGGQQAGGSMVGTSLAGMAATGSPWGLLAGPLSKVL